MVDKIHAELMITTHAKGIGMNAPDTRKLVSGTITWHEDGTSGRGYLRLELEDGGKEEIQCDTPITAKIDSWSIVNLFDGYEVYSLEHDKDTLHIQVLN